MANEAFDMMNDAADTDMYITGGSITVSDYEQNMTPNDQLEYEALLMDEFMAAYESDPHKGALEFKNWLGSLNFDLLRERALKYNEIIGSDNGSQKLIRLEDGRLLEDAGMLQRLAHLHTGRIEDIAELIKGMEPKKSPLNPSAQFKRPEGMSAPTGQPSQPASPPIDG